MVCHSLQIFSLHIHLKYAGCRPAKKKKKLKALNSLSEQFTFNNRLTVSATQKVFTPVSKRQQMSR